VPADRRYAQAELVGERHRGHRTVLQQQASHTQPGAPVRMRRRSVVFHNTDVT
jgi:hypothetical protein